MLCGLASRTDRKHCSPPQHCHDMTMQRMVYRELAFGAGVQLERSSAARAGVGHYYQQRGKPTALHLFDLRSHRSIFFSGLAVATWQAAWFSS